MIAPRRILVRLPNWVGDVVMATPALRALRQHWPEAEITAMVKDYAAPLIQGHPHVDHVWPLGDREERGLANAWRLGRRLRASRYDLGILFTNSWTSALPLWLGRVRIRVGYRGDGRTPLLTLGVAPERRAVRKQPIPMPRLYQRLLDHLGVTEAGPRYELPLGSTEVASVQARLHALGVLAHDRVIGLNPGARFGASKLWPVASFAKLAEMLRLSNFVPLVLGSAGEAALVRAVVDESGGAALDTSASPFGLGELPALCQRLHGMVTTDSGPRHIATWAEIPTVVLMGPTHPGWTDWNMEHTLVLRRDVSCGPCHKKICPTDHRCLETIPPEEAFSALMRLLPI